MTTDRRFKRPESVLVVIYTRSRECLLLERTQPSGFWQSVTGSLRWGETARTVWSLWLSTINLPLPPFFASFPTCNFMRN